MGIQFRITPSDELRYKLSRGGYFCVFLHTFSPPFVGGG
nr:MAG TPA: hypothetical protein [Caudoviricetes sp.]